MPEEVKTVEAVEIPVTEVTEPVKKTRRPKTKIRDIEELYDLPVKKLNEKEKDKLIEDMKEALEKSNTQMLMYKQNAKSAFEKINQTNEEFKAMELYYKKQLNYIAVQLAAFQTAVDQATKGGVI